jgi:hypothetical protein
MKTNNFFKSVLSAVVLTVVSTSAFAAGHGSINPYLKTDYAIISAVIPADETVHIVIADTEGNELYRSSKVDNCGSFQKLLDLRNLNDGTYKIFSEGKTSKLISSFEVRNRKLVVNKGNTSNDDVFKAFVHKNNKGILVSQINPNQAKSVMVISDANGNVVYSNEIPAKSSYNALYSINQLPAGSYTVSLTAGDKTQTYKFVK